MFTTLICMGIVGSTLSTNPPARALGPVVEASDSSEPDGLDDPEELELWPDGAPGATGSEAKDRPRLLVHRPPPDTATGVAIVVCPGGGYGHLAMDHEGRQVAEWLNGEGILAAIVDYRHRGKGYGHPAPLMDAQRAMRVVRAHAEEWSVEPDRVGVLGFSAGGHLAATVATLFDQAPALEAAHPKQWNALLPDDGVNSLSARPAFAVLIYPVILMAGPFAHSGSRRNLLGETPTPALQALLSPVEQVSEQSPPVFFVHTRDDRAVPAENSYALAAALNEKGVAHEIHVWPRGGHGFGLGKDLPAGTWPELCIRWLRDIGHL